MLGTSAIYKCPKGESYGSLFYFLFTKSYLIYI